MFNFPFPTTDIFKSKNLRKKRAQTHTHTKWKRIFLNNIRDICLAISESITYKKKITEMLIETLSFVYKKKMIAIFQRCVLCIHTNNNRLFLIV